MAQVQAIAVNEDGGPCGTTQDLPDRGRTELQSKSACLR